MQWVWQLDQWPKFDFKEENLKELNEEFLQAAGGIKATLKCFSEEDKETFMVEVLSTEGVKSSEIEGEILQRESVQSSIRKHFHLDDISHVKIPPKEKGMAALIYAVFSEYADSLDHNSLYHWHRLLFPKEINKELLIGAYRTHVEPMQIISSKFGDARVYFEAPPSMQVYEEMTKFTSWFNCSLHMTPLARASLTHLYFECVHPFEDGNGRIGRGLVEKALAQSIGHPSLVSLSKIIDKRKKEYYAALGMCNKSLDAHDWVLFFSELILEAQKESMKLLNFLIFKSKHMRQFENQINSRQEKVLLRIFQEGVEGFKGGLSADNYISITKCSRATTTRDLKDLVGKGALIKTGELRHTRYWLPLS